MSPEKLLGLAAFCLFLPSIGHISYQFSHDTFPEHENEIQSPLASEFQAMVSSVLLIPVQKGTSSTDASLETHSTTAAAGSPSTRPAKSTTMDPREAARQAALELSREIFRNITKQLRDSIAAKDFSVFTTTAVQEEQDDLHPFRHQPKHHHEHHWGPYFDEPLNGATALQVRTHLASEATLNCRVGMLRDKTVMWLRKTSDKVHLLTVGATTYSGDSRIAVKFLYPNNWRLSINPVQRDDAGLYMCQVSTHPPRVLLTNVTVLAPILKIVDEQGHEVRDRYYKAGSAIELSCRVSRAYTGTLSVTTSNSASVFIKPPTTTSLPTTTSTQSANATQPTTPLNSTTAAVNQTDNTDKTDGVTKATLTAKGNNSLSRDRNKTAENNNIFGITWHKDGKVLTEKVTSRNMSSTFKLSHAEQKDSGAYACSILNASTVTVTVQVLSGETQAAVHHDTLSNAATVIVSPISVYGVFVLLIKL